MHTNESLIGFTRYFALVVGVAFILAGIAGFLPLFTPHAPPEAPHLIVDANYGLLLEGTGKGTFRQVPQRQSGFRLQGDVRSVLPLGSMLLVGRNREKLIAYKSLRP